MQSHRKRGPYLALFGVLQLFVASVLFLSEIWVYSTEFAPRISSYMAFPFSAVLYISATSSLVTACKGSPPSTLLLWSLFVSLIWMVRAHRAFQHQLFTCVR